MIATENSNRKYLDPHIVAKLENLEIKARLVVEGFITGLHRSPYHGFSVEFAQHRQYHIGDELRRVDWKIYARTNRFYVKQYEEETNLRCMVAVDSSASMGYASNGNISKFEYASYLASALCFLMVRQKDAAGLATFDTEIKTYLPPRSKYSYLQEIIRTLETTTPSNSTGTAEALNQLAERISRRGFVVLISDFFDEPESVYQALRHFRHQRHDVLVIQVLDPRERDFNFGTPATFKDLESTDEIITQPYQIKKAYAKAVDDYLQSLKNMCHSNNIDYLLIDTSEPFDVALNSYIAHRSRR